MEQIVLKATRRDVIGKQVRAMRRAGQLPAVLYGTGVEPTAIAMDLKETSRLLQGLPTTAIVVIDLDGAQHKALIREKQRDPIRGYIRHIDFQAVSMEQKLRVMVPIELVGESPAVKDFDGILMNALEAVEIEAKPDDLPSSLKADISVLKAIGESLHVRDLVIPANVEVLTNEGEMVVLVTAPAAEEVEEVVEEIAEPEVIEKGKKEEEEEE